NSVVKRVIADGSVGSPHVRVGHRQALNSKKPLSLRGRGFFMRECMGKAFVQTAPIIYQAQRF
uniref:hypothetical protein n=1 Tax=Nitrincola schmidtii TaxID=1730894 RepID=UPI001981119F